MEIRKPALSSTGRPGGGIGEGESPEQAVRRELQKELGSRRAAIRELGTVDHVWSWKGREVRERAWLFLASSSDDARLSRGESPQLIEADGQHVSTCWRPIEDDTGTLPPLLPPAVAEFLK